MINAKQNLPPGPANPGIAQLAKIKAKFKANATANKEQPSSSKIIPPKSKTNMGVPAGRNVKNPPGGKAKGKEKEPKELEHSREFLRSFRPVRLFLQAFGRFPYRLIQNASGTFSFTFTHNSKVTIVFYLTTTIAFIMFLLMNIGFIMLFTGSTFSNYEDKCGHTWESLTLYRYIVIISLVYSWLVLTFVSSWETFYFTTVYVNFLNIWNKSVQSMKMNVTKGATWTGMSGNIEFVVVVILLTILFAAGLVPSLQDGLALMTSAMARAIIKDGNAICHRRGGFLNDSLTQLIRQNRSAMCGKSDTSPCEGTGILVLSKILGFLLMVYGLYGSRSTIVQFKFFCRLLRNASFVWNERLRNYKEGLARKGKIRGDVQCRVRLDMKSLLQDHLSVIQLFHVTEEVYTSTLKYYYAIQLINLVMQLYFFTQLTYPSSCDSFWETAENTFSCPEFTKYHMEESTKMRNGEMTRSFSDPCIDEQELLFQNGLVAFFLMFQTLFLFIDTTMDATLAYEEAMRGFEVLRRIGFVHCKSVHERNFIHSLVISYARSNPIQITANHYVVLNRQVIVGLLTAAFGYWIIIIQFRPGEIRVEFPPSLGCPDNCTGCCFTSMYNLPWDPSYQKDCNETFEF